MTWTGHSAVLHGCTVEDETFVGMGATLLDGVVLEKQAMVAAGALVRQNTRIPSGEVCLLVNQLLLLIINCRFLFLCIFVMVIRRLYFYVFIYL